jgi:putative transposase
VTRNFNHVNSDPGALGGASGLKCTENTKNNAKKKRSRIVNKIDGGGEEVILEPANVWALNAWAPPPKGLNDPRNSGENWARVWRTDTLRLVTNAELHDFLWHIGDQVARLINMENFRRRKGFFENKNIDYSWQSAWARRFAEYYSIYKLLGSANFHEACRLVSEEWKSFKELLKASKEGRLPPWMNPRPPGYRKRDGQRTPIVVVRFDNYEVDLKRRVLLLKYWKLEVPFKGKPRWLTRPDAKRGRLIIFYNEAKKRWYARVSAEVLLKRESSGKGFIGIDLGREVIVTAVASDGMALLYKGKVLKSDYYYFEKKIAAIDSALSKLEEVDRNALAEERRRLFEKRRKRRNQIFANIASHLARFAREHSIGAVFIGYPWNISQEKPGKGNINMWAYRRLVLRLATTLENIGIHAFLINEDNTSRKCAYHHIDAVRNPRGLITCPLGHTLHSDVNAALNIMSHGLTVLGIEVKLPKRIKVLSFLATPSKTIPIKP